MEIKIKQHFKVEDLGCLLDETMSEKAMALHVISKINNKLKFFHRKNRFLTAALRRLPMIPKLLRVVTYCKELHDISTEWSCGVT